MLLVSELQFSISAFVRLWVSLARLQLSSRSSWMFLVLVVVWSVVLGGVLWSVVSRRRLARRLEK